MTRCPCISCFWEVGSSRRRQPTSPVPQIAKDSTSWHHSQTFATCARCTARRRSAPLKKKRRRAPGRLIAKPRGSLACAANSERHYASGNHPIGDRAKRCRVRAFAPFSRAVSHLLTRRSAMMWLLVMLRLCPRDGTGKGGRPDMFYSVDRSGLYQTGRTLDLWQQDPVLGRPFWRLPDWFEA